MGAAKEEDSRILAQFYLVRKREEPHGFDGVTVTRPRKVLSLLTKEN